MCLVNYFFLDVDGGDGVNVKGTFPSSQKSAIASILLSWDWLFARGLNLQLTNQNL